MRRGRRDEISMEEVFTSFCMRSIWQPHPLRRLLPCFLLPPQAAGTATTTAIISASTTAIASCAAI